VQKQTQRQMTQKERKAFALSLPGALLCTAHTKEQEMATAIGKQERAMKAAQAVAFFARRVLALWSASVFLNKHHEANPALPATGSYGSDWKRSYRIRGGIPLVANG